MAKIPAAKPRVSPTLIAKMKNSTIPNPSALWTLESISPSPISSKLRPYSYHICEAIKVCQRWGVVHYGMNKVYDSEARAMALEAGGLMHDVFAGVRLWQLANTEMLPEHAMFHANRIYGNERFEALKKGLIKPSKEPSDEHLLNFAFDCLHTSDWYDDPRDDIRTMANMEASTIRYVREYMEFFDVFSLYIADRKRPNSMVGIELFLDVILRYTDDFSIRYIGTIDAILRKLKNNVLYLGENKTSVRLDDAWRQSFELSHQVTGYNAIATTVIGEPVIKTKVFGLKIKPTNYHDDFIPIEPQDRNEAMIQKWAQWVRSCVSDYERIGNDYESSELYTNSCNRYFRPCALIAFCTDDEDGRKGQIKTMVERGKSPSELALMEKAG